MATGGGCPTIQSCRKCKCENNQAPIEICEIACVRYRCVGHRCHHARRHFQRRESLQSNMVAERGHAREQTGDGGRDSPEESRKRPITLPSGLISIGRIGGHLAS